MSFDEAATTAWQILLFVVPRGKLDPLKETFLVGFAFEHTGPRRTLSLLLTAEQRRMSEHAGL